MSKVENYFYPTIVIVLLLFVSSCKTDPKGGTEVVMDNKPFTVVSHLAADPEGLNPITARSVNSRAVTNQIFSHIVHYDVKTLLATPMLIKEMPRIEKLDGDKYPLAAHFELHEEAKWDNGTPVTGHDVEFTLKTILNPKVAAGHLRPTAEKFKAIEVDKSNPKKFTLYADLYFLVNEIFTDFPILPSYVYDEKGLMKEYSLEDLSNSKKIETILKSENNLQEFADDFNDAKFSREIVVGCGPYELKEWVTGQRIILKKKDNWWGNKLGEKYSLLQAYPQEIIFKPIPDQTTAVTELKGGAIDLMATISSKQFNELKTNEVAKQNLNLHTIQEFVYYYIGINRKNPKLADKKVRRAIAHLVDTQEIIDVVMLGYGEPIIGPFHPSRPYYKKELPLIDFNTEKARALLKEAGWDDSNNDGIVDKIINGKKVELDLELLITNSGSGPQIAELVKNSAKKGGVGITVKATDFRSQIEARQKRNYELTASAWGQDPTDDPKQIWHTSSDTPDGSNQSGFGNAESDQLIEEIRETFDEKKRNELFRKFQDIVYEDQPYVFLLARSGRSAINKKFDAKPSSRKPHIFENQFKLAKGEVSMK